MTNKAIFSYVYQLTNERMRLNLGAFTYFYVLLNFNKRSDKYFTTNRTPIKIYWFYYNHIIAKIDIYNIDLFDFELIQKAPPSLQCLGKNRK